MPAYNAATYLREAIESILNQTFFDFELIIINDGSIDETENIVLSLTDTRILYIKNEKNLGLITSLNKGIDIARGEFIARMDADDISLPERFEVQLKLLGNSGADVVCSPVKFINAKGDEIGVWDLDCKTLSEKSIKQVLPFDNCVAHPSVIIKASLLKKYKYNPAQKGSEDWDLWLRLIRDNYRIVKTPEVLLKYRNHSGSTTQIDNRKQQVEYKILEVRQKFIIDSFKKSKITQIVFQCIYGNARTRARIFKLNYLPPLLSFFKRLFTINPFVAIRQYNQLKKGIAKLEPAILLVFPYSHVGGAERVHADIVHALKEKNPLVIFGGIHKETRYLQNFLNTGANVYNVGLALNYFITASSTKRIIEHKLRSNPKIKILGCNAFYFYELAKIFSKSHEVSELIHDYTFNEKDEWTLQNANLLRSLSNRVFISNRALQQTCQLYNFLSFPESAKKHLKWIVNCTSIPAEAPHKNYADLKIVFIGRNSAEKRPHLVFKIIEGVRKQTNKIQFSFVGDFENRKMDGVNFYGVVYEKEKMEQIFNSHQVLLLTSVSEGFPMVIMEAMAHGLVSVSTPVGDIPLHVTRDRGVLLDNASEEAVVESACNALLNMLKEKDKLQLMGINAYQYAKENFSAERFRADYLKLF